VVGLTAAVYSCFQLSLWLAGPIIRGRHLSLTVWRKITVNVFYSTRTNVFLFLITFLRFLTFFILGGGHFFIYVNFSDDDDVRNAKNCKTVVQRGHDAVDHDQSHGTRSCLVLGHREPDTSTRPTSPPAASRC